MKNLTQADLAQGLNDELLDVIWKYHEAMLVPTVLGVLDVVKYTILMEHMDDEDEDV